MSTETANFLLPRTPEDASDLIEKILENPDEVVSYDNGACYLAAIERDDQWDVWSYCEESRSLCHEGTFESCAEARSHARDRGEEILEEVAQVQTETEDAEWEARAATSGTLVAPFTFQDTTDFQDGVELEDAEDVFAFFRRHQDLLRPEAWGNLYSCSLTDGNGTVCWVSENHRGDMRIEAGM